MINVDIYIAALNQSYEVQVEENTSIESLIMEISDMIAVQTKSGNHIETGKFMLCSMDRDQVLEKARSLNSYQIRNGARLMLV